VVAALAKSEKSLVLLISCSIAMQFINTLIDSFALC